VSIAIEPGDVLARTGLVNIFGKGFNVLSTFISEPYNHSGVAISAFQVHHVESHGYETILVKNFFECKNAGAGAVIRFVGPLAYRIRSRVADVASKGRYKRIPGNPFSTSLNANTVNCNEFVYSLFQIAIKELLEETHVNEPGVFLMLSEAYSKKSLIQSKQIRMKLPGKFGSFIAGGAEIVGHTQASHPDVKVQFEGNVNCVPKIPVLCLATEIVLDTYTPDSFIHSPYFKVVERRGCLR
jgi:hypothetical protein